MELLTEICNHCGRDVSFGSGLFVNRIPDFNGFLTRFENNYGWPHGDFVCMDCDSDATDAPFETSEAE